MFMHNGGIGGWKYVKRRLAASLKDEWFIFVQGGTDSEWAFALFLDSMSKMGYNPSKPPANGFGHTVLRKAILETIRRINKFIAEIPEECREEDTRSLLNFAVTDGVSVVCTRYVSSRTDEAASLFWSSGTNWRENCDASERKGDYKMERRDKGADIVLVASEPLTFERGESFSSSFAFKYILTLPTRQLGHGSDKLDAYDSSSNGHDSSHY
jgi:glutamine amidotransferase